MGIGCSSQKNKWGDNVLPWMYTMLLFYQLKFLSVLLKKHWATHWPMPNKNLSPRAANAGHKPVLLSYFMWEHDPNSAWPNLKTSLSKAFIYFNVGGGTVTLGQGPEMKTTRKCWQHNKPIGIKIIDLQSRNKL